MGGRERGELLPTLARCRGFAGEEDLLVSDGAVSEEGAWVQAEALPWHWAHVGTGTPAWPRLAQTRFSVRPRVSSVGA